ncbi:efflux RND transporter permease subunit [Brevibacillus sp. SYP-B805]|uniref:efflux RND transporter permease subunit n=1 Tax=Brevibacillus sp. SYP-B805 TaxID=1578199 RepID=UPI0013EBC6B6|nr:efflux RND transporter permease subunit [Brevibacillus sp. SYP-B805]NGQ97381.1 efflux RND transporter permease subunit [Brevibacillus sp. SYP-B805]
MHISDHAIRRPVTVMMGVLIVIILGIISLTRIPIDLYPPIEIPTVAVSTSYSGVGPEEMENLVTKPIEQAVAQVAGIKSVRSVSREGSSQVTVEFDYGADMDEAFTEIQQKVERARRSLPDDADAPTVMRFDPNSTPVLTLAISADMGPDQLRSFVDEQIVPYLERVNGVASVTVSGGMEREIKVLIDQSRLEQYGLTISDINQQLRNQNIDSPGGKVTEGGTSYTVRSIGKFTSVDDIRKVAIPLKNDGHVLLGDIAVVQEGYKEVSIDNRLNGQPTVSLSIMKQSGTNTVQVVDGIHEELNKLKTTLPANMTFFTLSDQSQFIRASIDTLVHDTLVGGVLAILIIWLFLKSISNTLIISTAIPISVIATFALMFFADMSINTMSLGGLTLGIGMIVDDAIVVLENIHRHRENGLPISKAAVTGTKEVAMPVIAATLTTVAVFFPIVFVEGVTAQLFRDLGVTVSFALLASLVVSLTVTPMLTVKWTAAHLQKAAGRGEERKAASKHSVYGRLLAWSLSHRKTVVAVGIASLLAGVALVPFIGMELMPTTDQGQVSISISLPNGTELEKTQETLTVAQTIVSKIPEVETIFTSLGSASAMRGNNASSSSASLLLILSDLSKRKRTTAEIVEEIRQKLNRFPGARVRVSAAGGMGMPGLGGQGFGGGSAPIAYAVRGNDEETLTDLAQRLTAAIAEVDGVREADNTLEESSPEIQVTLDRVRAAELGVTQASLSSAIQAALRDQVATRFETGGTEIDVTVTTNRERAASMQDIENLLINTSNGEKVQVKDVATVSLESGPPSIQRYNQARVVTVTAMLAPGRDLGSVSEEINKIVAAFPTPPGYVIEQQGENQQLDDTTRSMILAFILAVVLVYIILAAQFESLVYPLSIMLSVPLSFFGASFSLWVTGRPLSIPAFIGIILLAGIVVRNAIVLIDFTNILRRQGVSRTEAILTAAPIRLRPILMTTLCTVLGLLPLALGFGEGGESQAPMATVVIGGLLFSTLLTLVVIPVVYTILDDMAARLKKVVHIFLPFRRMNPASIEK